MLVIAHKNTTVPDGADGIEFDVIKTADGDLAVSHDEAVKGGGYVHQKTMDELRSLGFVSLRDVFHEAAARAGGPPLLNIEIKGQDCWETAWRQAREFCAETGYPYERIVFSSFDHAQLLKLRQADHEAKIGLIFGSTLGRWALPLKLHPETGGEGRRKSLTVDYLDSVLDTVKPTSLHPTTWNFDRAASYAAKNNLDLFVWASDENVPEKDARMSDLVHKHAGNPHINIITDHPAEMRRLFYP
jgi:glycerophosphoryl diester phosphodiesterase